MIVVFFDNRFSRFQRKAHLAPSFHVKMHYISALVAILLSLTLTIFVSRSHFSRITPLIAFIFQYATHAIRIT
jgi:ABC-type proline/glycine betaine transport system permease subunit